LDPLQPLDILGYRVREFGDTWVDSECRALQLANEERTMVPRARAQGIDTDDDVFDALQRK
jgi:hypothetical protein